MSALPLRLLVINPPPSPPRAFAPLPPVLRFEPPPPPPAALAGTELNAGARGSAALTNAPTLVNGTIYTIAFNGTDAAGNTATQVSVTSITFDTTDPVISSVSPSTSSSVNTTAVGYTLSEAIASGSVVWTRTGGTADGNSPHTAALAGTELNTGQRASAVLTNAPTLVNGTIYTIAFNGTDAGGNAATEVSVTGITFDTTAPTIIASTTIASDNSTATVTFSEAVFDTNGGSGALEATDFTLSISGGVATLGAATPTSISISGNAYTLGFNLSGTPTGAETLRIVPSSATAIYDAAGNAASTSQSNNTITLNDQLSPTVSGTTVASDNTTIAVTFSEAVYNTTGGSGALEVSDFTLSISGGTATVGSTPSSISISGKVDGRLRQACVDPTGYGWTFSNQGVPALDRGAQGDSGGHLKGARRPLDAGDPRPRSLGSSALPLV